MHRASSPSRAGEPATRLEHAEALKVRGNALRAEGRNEEALASYDSALALEPDFVAALYNRGNTLLALNRPRDALAAFDRVLELDPRDAQALSDHGNALVDLDCSEEALASYERALAIDPRHVAALYNRGNLLSSLGRHEDALESYDRVVALEPANLPALYGRANALLALNRPEHALASYEGVLALDPNLTGAFNNRGNALQLLGRPEEALISYDRVLALEPDSTEALSNRACVLLGLRRPAEALASCERALVLRPAMADALYHRSNALLALTRYADAVASFDRLLELSPDHVEAHHSRGNTLLEMNQAEAALASYERALALNPDFPEALLNRGAALIYLGRHEDAGKDIERAMAANPDLKFARGMLLYLQMRCCDWNSYDERARQLCAGVRDGKLASPPFIFLGVSDSAQDQLHCARLWVREECAPQPALWQGERYRHERIRVAYLSSDFRDHPVANQIAELIEGHDARRFAISAVAFGPESGDPIRSRLKAAVEQFIDVDKWSDRDVAAWLRQSEIDIAVDLNGFTTGGRTRILALRPAPVQVNYLGYPGTMGADYIDYILADGVVIPAEHHDYYQEHVVCLPDSFMPNSAKRHLPRQTPTRKEAGLPEGGFVFCSFNNLYKLTPSMFDIWMRLLREVDGSVLWLRSGNATVVQNLRHEAAARKVAPERIVFAPKVQDIADHIARHRLADLFLDTLPYNAHSTASDALQAGVPVLTCLGGTFAGRVAASLLRAIGLPELIVHSHREYEALALALATDEPRLVDIRQKLARNRDSCTLFDSERYRRHIEAAYTAMWERAERGEPPASFDVAAIG